MIFREAIVDFFDNGDLINWARHQDHTVSLNALMFASYEKSFWTAIAIDQLAPKPVTRWSPLAKSELNQPALSSKHLY